MFSRTHFTPPVNDIQARVKRHQNSFWIMTKAEWARQQKAKPQHCRENSFYGFAVVIDERIEDWRWQDGSEHAPKEIDDILKMVL